MTRTVSRSFSRHLKISNVNGYEEFIQAYHYFSDPEYSEFTDMTGRERFNFRSDSEVSLIPNGANLITEDGLVFTFAKIADHWYLTGEVEFYD